MFKCIVELEEIVNVVLFLVSDESSFVIGIVMCVEGGVLII